MMSGERQRKRIISARALGAGDILPLEFVRLITGGPVGFVESVDNGFAVVSWLKKPGHKDIIPCSILMRLS